MDPFCEDVVLVSCAVVEFGGAGGDVDCLFDGVAVGGDVSVFVSDGVCCEGCPFAGVLVSGEGE